MSTSKAVDLRIVGYEHNAAQTRVVDLLAQQRAAAARDDLRAVRLLAAPLRDAQARYRSTAATLAAAADSGVLAGTS